MLNDVKGVDASSDRRAAEERVASVVPGCAKQQRLPRRCAGGFSGKLVLSMILVLINMANVSFAKELPRELERAIRASLETHPDVASAQANVLSARAQVTAGEYRWYPRGDFAVRAGKPGDRYGTVAVNQTLWDAGRLDADFDATKANESVASASKTGTVQDIALRAAVAYMNVLRTREQLVAAEKNAALHANMLETVESGRKLSHF